MSSPSPYSPCYPALLEAQITHADQFARTLRRLHDDAGADDAAFLWLEGRAEEVGAFADDVVGAWLGGELTTGAAVRVINDYLHALHASLEGWYGRWYAPSCCGPLAGPPPSGVRERAASRVRRRVDSLTDTVVDAPAAPIPPGDRGAAPVALACAHAMAPRDPSRSSLHVRGLGGVRGVGSRLLE
jgi:hypothetical protein